MDQFLKSYDTFQEEQPCYQGFFVAAFSQDKFMVKDVKSLNNFDNTQQVYMDWNFFPGSTKLLPSPSCLMNIHQHIFIQPHHSKREWF